MHTKSRFIFLFSIHLFLYSLSFAGSQGKAVIRRDAGSNLDRSPVHHTATQRHTGQTTIHTLITREFLERPINLILFGLWVEAAVSGQNPHMHMENMQNIQKKSIFMQKDLRSGFKPRTFLLEDNSAISCAANVFSVTVPKKSFI